MAGDNCPKDCKHETFHYCDASGTHCDKHCVCGCEVCRKDRKNPAPMGNSGGKILIGATIVGDSETQQVSVTIGDTMTYMDGKITVERRSGDYMAYITGHKEKWDCGKTVAEAIGRLVISQSKEFAMEEAFSPISLMDIWPDIDNIAATYCHMNSNAVAHVSVEEFEEGKYKVKVSLEMDDDRLAEIELDTLATPENLKAYDTLIPFGFACKKEYRENAMAGLLSQGELTIINFDHSIRICLDIGDYSGTKDVLPKIVRPYVHLTN